MAYDSSANQQARPTPMAKLGVFAIKEN